MTGGFVRKALFALAFMGLGSVGTLAGSALAQPGNGWAGTARGGAKAAVMDKLVEDLNLDAAQMAKGAEVNESIKTRLREMREARTAGFEEIAAELSKPEIDRKAVHKIADRRLDALEQNIHATVDDFLSFVDTLDPQQRATLVNDLRTLKAAKGARRGARTAAPE
jgi:hypothetical protein